ncbi:MAG TPA: DUF4398 domain-containing protein [Gammaproteobacteria bacterium]|nr:DUF4398 domain-containing protein [Gammaproteobacteria bacterium]
MPGVTAGFGRKTLIIMLLLLGAGCASAPPVQEMSDARQAVQAAREADARHYAPISLGEAERLLEEATRLLEKKEYRRARQVALAAKEMALKARHVSWAKQHDGDEP